MAVLLVVVFQLLVCLLGLPRAMLPSFLFVWCGVPLLFLCFCVCCGPWCVPHSFLFLGVTSGMLRARSVFLCWFCLLINVVPVCSFSFV